MNRYHPTERSANKQSNKSIPQANVLSWN